LTLPLDIILPEPQDFKIDSDRFLDDLVTRLQDMYEDIATSFNGSYRSNASSQGSTWTPTLSGSTSGSFTYTSQKSWLFRQGIMCDVWGYIAWSSTTASGTLQVDLPYKVTLCDAPLTFTGACSLSGVTFSGSSVTINAVSNSYYANVTTFGTGVSSSLLSVPPSGAITYGVRYIGVADE